MVKTSAVSERRGIQSVEIGMSVLSSLAKAPGALTLKEVASAADLPSSNCHRYLVSLVRSGFVAQDAGTGRYDLGPAVLQVGLAALGRIDAIAVATEALEVLVDETGHTGMVVIWADAGPTIIRWMQGRQAVRTTLAPGVTLPVLTTATGQVFRAFLPARQTAARCELEQREASASARIDHALVRAAGFAQVAGDHIPGLNAAAAPILDAAGEAAAVLTLVSAGGSFTKRSISALLRRARSASTRLGGEAPAS